MIFTISTGVGFLPSTVPLQKNISRDFMARNLFRSLWRSRWLFRQGRDPNPPKTVWKEAVWKNQPVFVHVSRVELGYIVLGIRFKLLGNVINSTSCIIMSLSWCILGERDLENLMQYIGISSDNSYIRYWYTLAKCFTSPKKRGCTAQNRQFQVGKGLGILTSMS